MSQGWVYILVNPSMPGLVKIGQTAGLPIDRAAELSRHTGVATPFVLIFEQAFSDCVLAEQGFHTVLDRYGMRYNLNREFFRGPIPEIIRLLLAYAQLLGDGILPTSDLTGEELLRQGDCYLIGDADTLQDHDEAIRCYHMASRRGCVVAFERLGAYIAQAHGGGIYATHRAKSYLKEGTRRGNYYYYCHCELATLAAQEGHTANFLRSWDQFFAQRAASYLPEAEAGRDRYVRALVRYINACFAVGVVPGHVDELKRQGDALVQTLSTMQASMHGIRNLDGPLRWSHRMLLGRAYEPSQGKQRWMWRLRPAPLRYSAHALKLIRVA